MEPSKKISIEQCCIYYEIETAFVQQLDAYGLIELSSSEKKKYISFEQLPSLEKFIRMYYELDINIEGIEAIHHLLNRIELLQQQVNELKGS